MTPTQQTVQNILAVTNNQTASKPVVDRITAQVDGYYGARGQMAKMHVVGLILDDLNLKWGEYAGKVSECFIG